MSVAHRGPLSESPDNRRNELNTGVVRTQLKPSRSSDVRFRRNVTARPSIREGPLATPIPIFGGGGCALHSRPSSSEFPGAGDRGYPVETQLVAADQPWLPRGDTLMTAGPQQGAFGLGPVVNDRLRAGESRLRFGHAFLLKGNASVPEVL